MLDQCRDVYAERQGRPGAEDGDQGPGSVAAATAAAAAVAAAKSGKAPTQKELAFRAAVDAARKRPPAARGGGAGGGGTSVSGSPAPAAAGARPADSPQKEDSDLPPIVPLK